MELDNVINIGKPKNLSNAELQVLFEDEPYTFIDEVTNSLMGRDSDFRDILTSENYKFIQELILERMKNDSEFFEKYAQTCFLFLFACVESIPEKYHEFLLDKLSDNNTLIRRAIFILLRDRKISLDRNRFIIDLQNEIENVLNGDDDLPLQHALEIISTFGTIEFKLILIGAQQKFAQKITELRTQPSETNIWHEAYLHNAIAGIQQALH